MTILNYLAPHYRKHVLVILDAVMVAVSFWAALMFQYPGQSVVDLVVSYRWILGAIIIVKLALFQLFGLYEFIWRYASTQALFRVIKAVSMGSLVVASLHVFTRFEALSGRVIALDWLIALFLIGGLRVFLRLYRDYLIQLEGEIRPARQRPRSFIIGAGDGGELALRESLRNPKYPYQVVGFLDDNLEKSGKTIHGVPVLGSLKELGRLAKIHQVTDAVIAIPSAPGPVLRQIVARCDQAGIRYKLMPNLRDYFRVATRYDLRSVNIEDLLGREVVSTDLHGIADYISGEIVFVTGAGGSIGSELCRQLVQFSPSKLVLIDHAETALYTIDMDLKNLIAANSGPTIIPIVADVKSEAAMGPIFERYRPRVVFHAAAYKHVPLMEDNVAAAIQNNIGGSYTVFQLCGQFQVAECVLISTDKAVRPTNVMGATKRVCELLLQHMAGMYPNTTFAAVRFGNVLGSQGSVVPLFKRQIEMGGPVTVTHPDVTRYFMTVSEAVRLVIQAGAFATGGEFFILDMGQPVKIVDLAKDMIQISGASADEIDIVFTGLRPGEKLYEELFYDPSRLINTQHQKIFVVNPPPPGDGAGLDAILALVAQSRSNLESSLRVQLMKLIEWQAPSAEGSL